MAFIFSPPASLTAIPFNFIIMKQKKYLLLIFLFAAGFFSGSAQMVSTQKGLTTAIFNLSSGAIKFHLPKDIRAGDIISGSIEVEPAGKTPKQMDKNLAELKKYTVDLDGQKFPVLNSFNPVQYKINDNKLQRSLSLVNSNGTNMGQVSIDCAYENKNEGLPKTCKIPSHALTAEPLRITGPFDGNSSNTSCNVSGKEVTVLAESSGQCFVSFPANVKGTQSLNVQEQGTQPCTQNVSAVNMNVEAGKLNLLRGERTYIDVTISGLQGLSGLALLTLNNVTAGIVTMQPANNVIIPLNPDSVGSGDFSRHFIIQSINSGGFTVNVNLDLPEPAKDLYTDIPATNNDTKTDTVPCKDLEEKVKAAEEALQKLKDELAGIDNQISGTQKSLDDCNKALAALLSAYHAKKKTFDDQNNTKKNWEKSGKKLSDEKQKSFDKAEQEKNDAAKEWSDQNKKCKALADALAALKARKAALPGLIATGEGELKGLKDELEKCKTKAAEDKKKKEEEERRKTEPYPPSGSSGAGDNINPGTGADKEGSPCNPDGLELVEPVKRVYGPCFVKETEITPCNTNRISNEVLEAVKKAFEKFKNLKGPLEIAEKVADCASTAKAVCVNIHIVRNWEDVQLTYICVKGKWVLKNRKVTGRGEDDYGWFIVKDKEIGNLCCWVFGKKEDAEKVMEAHLKEAIQDILDQCK